MLKQLLSILAAAVLAVAVLGTALVAGACAHPGSTHCHADLSRCH